MTTCKPSRHFSCAQFINESPEAELVATIWPTELDVLQAKHAMKQGITELDKCTLKEFYERHLTASLNSGELELKLGNKGRANEAEKIAKKFQYNLCGEKFTLSNITLLMERPLAPVREQLVNAR